MDPQRVVDMMDENTIGVCAELGNNVGVITLIHASSDLFIYDFSKVYR
jgi:hypothetical protein